MACEHLALAAKKEAGEAKGFSLVVSPVSTTDARQTDARQTDARDTHARETS